MMDGRDLGKLGVGAALAGLLTLAGVGGYSLMAGDSDAAGRDGGRSDRAAVAPDTERLETLLAELQARGAMSRDDAAQLAQWLQETPDAWSGLAAELGYAGSMEFDLGSVDWSAWAAWQQAQTGAQWQNAGGYSGSIESYGYANGQAAGGGWSAGAGQTDNYYNSRVGTGNYSADGSSGYVYIPGTGSVSYGM